MKTIQDFIGKLINRFLIEQFRKMNMDSIFGKKAGPIINGILTVGGIIVGLCVLLIFLAMMYCALR